ncbi:hypothetical protein [Pseudomonas sp. CMR5c]|uniref:hypothetical protein n=1 Tax=Pseudomonas sp. CMR5c TaxID=658630 RepID=UPI000B082315|nr:hypothetical protein [Pseudomonas sp. CMR5c]AZC18871.1 hypothetical protein C4K40_3483 [Pseudomonas sp. CMR5c]
MDGRLPKSIDVRTYTRPIKVAFLVPGDDSCETNLILDAVFHDSYSRWGGANSLIVSCNDASVIDSSYVSWLEFYEPDLIYVYVKIQESDLCFLSSLCPVRIISHQCRVAGGGNWRNYLPDYGGVTPVLSVSTLYDPRRGLVSGRNGSAVHLCLTQFKDVSKNRFLPDNFGVAHHNYNCTNEVSGVYETISCCDEGVPESNKIATRRFFSECFILEGISSGQVSTFSQLSSASAFGVYHAVHNEWSNVFNLFVGSTAADRVCFWNSRLLSGSKNNVNESAILVSLEQLLDEEFVAALGKYLNGTNFKHSGSGQSKVNIRSQSIGKDTCIELAGKIQPLTWNSIRTEETFNFKPEFEVGSFTQDRGVSNPSFKTQERKIKFLANEPEHFRFLPPGYLEARNGHWVIDFDIERHQGDERYSNVLNDWKLPRRRELVSVFANSPGKITRRGTLAILAVDNCSLAMANDNKKSHQVSISFPEDELVFKRLIQSEGSLGFDDLREGFNYKKYEFVELSDKGLNHRGIVSKFRGPVEAADILANCFWRSIIRACVNKPNKKYTMNQLEALIQQISITELRKISDRSFVDVRSVKKYLLSSLKDTVEYLIHLGVVQQLYVWRCTYCGSDNKRNINTLRLDNDCDVCQFQHLYPVDAEWKYRIAPFVVESLAERNGLTVLMAIAYLLKRSDLQQSIYLPEINLYDNVDDKNCINEVDIVAIVDGVFFVVEVKLSAASFVDSPREIDNFIAECERLRPDTAVLFFEQYCETKLEEEVYRDKLSKLTVEIAEKLPVSVKLEVITASDLESYRDLSHCSGVGVCGERANSF